MGRIVLQSTVRDMMNSPDRKFATDHTRLNYLRTGEGIEGVDYKADFLVEPNFGDQGASVTLSAISRAEWEDFKKNYQPVLQELISMYGTKGLDQETNRNVTAVAESYDKADRTASDMRKLYNTNMTRSQFDQYRSNFGMQKRMATIHASNMTRLARKDRNEQLMAGTTSNLTSKMEAARQ